MAGEINGTDANLAVELIPAGGMFANVGGVMTNSTTFGNNPIDITNKSSASFRELLAGEGLQTLDITAEIVFNSDANFLLMKDSYLAKTILNYEIARGTDKLSFGAMIESWNETAPDNDKLTVSVSLQSHGPITDAP